MNTNELMPIIQRKRRPLQTATMPDAPKPLAVGEVCPHCGRVVAAETNAEAPKQETGTARGDARPTTEAETPAPVEISKTKKSRDDAAKN